MCPARWERLECGIRAVPFLAVWAVPGPDPVQCGRALLLTGTWAQGPPVSSYAKYSGIWDIQLSRLTRIS